MHCFCPPLRLIPCSPIFASSPLSIWVRSGPNVQASQMWSYHALSMGCPNKTQCLMVVFLIQATFHLKDPPLILTVVSTCRPSFTKASSCNSCLRSTQLHSFPPIGLPRCSTWGNIPSEGHPLLLPAKFDLGWPLHILLGICLITSRKVGF